MILNKTTFTFKDVYTGTELDCTVSYEPHNPDGCIVDEALHKGEDIMYMLSDGVIKAIEYYAASIIRRAA